jgi:hypothetical protein
MTLVLLMFITPCLLHIIKLAQANMSEESMLRQTVYQKLSLASKPPNLGIRIFHSIGLFSQTCNLLLRS